MNVVVPGGQRAEFLVQNVRLATNDPVCLARKTVELEVDRRSAFRQLGKECVVTGDALAVGVDHHVADVPSLGRAEHRHDVGVN